MQRVHTARSQLFTLVRSSFAAPLQLVRAGSQLTHSSSIANKVTLAMIIKQRAEAGVVAQAGGLHSARNEL